MGCAATQYILQVWDFPNIYWIDFYGCIRLINTKIEYCLWIPLYLTSYQESLPFLFGDLWTWLTEPLKTLKEAIGPLSRKISTNPILRAVSGLHELLEVTQKPRFGILLSIHSSLFIDSQILPPSLTPLKVTSVASSKLKVLVPSSTLCPQAG